MSSTTPLSFTPSDLRERCWVADTPDIRYTIYASLSGYVVNYQCYLSGATGLTPAPQRLRRFFASFDEAVRACLEHYGSRELDHVESDRACDGLL